MFFIKIISFFPFSFLYLISDFLSLLLIYVIPYRRKVVINNLKIAFPEKSDAEVKRIKRLFYKNLCDVIVEIIKSYSISSKEIIKRVEITNVHLINTYFKKQVPIIVMTPHLCNWEWLLLSNCLLLDYPVDAVYKRLKNETFNEFMKKIRGKFGANLIEKDALIRDIAKRRNVARIIAMVSDQSPSSSKNNEWYKFFGKEIPFYSGAEKISKMTGYPVLFVAMERVKRGYYSVEFSEIKNLEETNSDHVTENFISKVESAIVKNPADYLWSHKRWKHSRNTEL